MRIAISGSTGLVGTSLVTTLAAKGHEVARLVRRPARDANDIFYDVGSGLIDQESLARVDAVVHLAGESVGDGRWSSQKKERILSSRVQSTRLIASALAQCDRPKTLICASAIGFYGERGDELVDEQSAPGAGFLADVCVQWERACEPARVAGIRTVNTRIGVVLAHEGGALSKMITPFKLGLGGVLGAGDQWMSWVSLEDIVGALAHLLESSSLSGPVNLVAPTPVTNRQLTHALGRHLRRPTVLPMPAFAARLAFGERADALLLSSTRASSRKLIADGYTFQHREIGDALAAILAHTPSEAA